MKVTVRLEYSAFNKRTQKFRDMVSGAKSFDQAVEALVRDGNGMTREEAVKIAKLMNLDGVREYNINVHAPDLHNLRDFTVLGGPGDEQGKRK